MSLCSCLVCVRVCVLLPEQSVCDFVSTKQLHGTLGLVSSGELFGPRVHCGPAPSLEWAHAGPMAANATSRITIGVLLRVPKTRSRWNQEPGPQTVAHARLRWINHVGFRGSEGGAFDLLLSNMWHKHHRKKTCVTHTE